MRAITSVDDIAERHPNCDGSSGARGLQSDNEWVKSDSPCRHGVGVVKENLNPAVGRMFSAVGWCRE